MKKFIVDENVLQVAINYILNSISATTTVVEVNKLINALQNSVEFIDSKESNVEQADKVEQLDA